MAKVLAIVPVSDLRQGAARVLKNLKKSSKPLFITQRGQATAVLMSLDTYERFEAERELLLLLARGEKEIAAGVGHSLDEVLAEAEAMAPTLEGARDGSRLPARPDVARADALLRRIGEELARRWVTAAPGPFGLDAPKAPEVTWSE